MDGSLDEFDEGPDEVVVFWNDPSLRPSLPEPVERLFAEDLIYKRLIGLVLIGIAVLIVVGSYVWKYVTSKYEVAAAATGAGDIFSTVSSVFR